MYNILRPNAAMCCSSDIWLRQSEIAHISKGVNTRHLLCMTVVSCNRRIVQKHSCLRRNSKLDRFPKIPFFRFRSEAKVT